MTNTATAPQLRLLADLFAQEIALHTDHTRTLTLGQQLSTALGVSVASLKERAAGLAALLTKSEASAEITARIATIKAHKVWLASVPALQPEVLGVAVQASAVPAPAKAAVVPNGSYALDGDDGKLRFYDVETPTKGNWKGFTFVKVNASDERYPIKGAERTRILAEIAVDPKTAASRYGLHFKVCACCHKQLTDETSRAIGLGPICAKRF